MEFILDFQGFKDENNKFVVKELALISTNGLVYELQLFRPPCDFNQLPESVKKQVIWLENYHGLNWGTGIRHYSELKDVFSTLNMHGTVFVKGIEKTNFVTELLSEFNVTVVNIENIGCPSLKNLKQQSAPRVCSFNHSSENCAYVNVYALLEWLKIKKHADKKLEKVKLAVMEHCIKIQKDLQSYIDTCFSTL